MKVKNILIPSYWVHHKNNILLMLFINDYITSLNSPGKALSLITWVFSFNRLRRGKRQG
jgi:hypothetical protein